MSEYMPIMHNAVKVEKGEVVDIITFEKEDECNAFCMQYSEYESIPSTKCNLHQAFVMLG